MTPLALALAAPPTLHEAIFRLERPAEVVVTVAAIESVTEGETFHEALAHAPILSTRRGSLERFSDLPLLMWVETVPVEDARELRYSVVFSNEDGGTPPDRLMATWGRVTDIELVYVVALDRQGRVARESYQGKGHVMHTFRGRKEGNHPVLRVVTKNNMVSDRGPQTPRLAPALIPFALEGVAREAVMDAHPRTYRVSGQEVRREGRVRAGGRPGSKQIPDPREFIYLEACGVLTDARLAFDVGVRTDALDEGDQPLPSRWSWIGPIDLPVDAGPSTIEMGSEPCTFRLRPQALPVRPVGRQDR